MVTPGGSSIQSITCKNYPDYRQLFWSLAGLIHRRLAGSNGSPALGPSPLGKPLIKGQRGALFIFGTVIGGVLLPLLTRLGFRSTRKAPSRNVNIVSSLLVLIGGLIMRYVWVYAGHDSAQDPQATHEYNRIAWEERTNKR
nr:hypothetical protein [Dictyobacter vulcani]